MDDNIFKDMALEYFKGSESWARIQKALDIVSKVQREIAILNEKKGEEKLTLIKVGTILTFGILKKLFSGKDLKEFNNEDWKEIGNAVNEFAVITDNQKYSEFVFLLYAEYIDFSLATCKGILSDKAYCSIKNLSDILRENTELLQKGLLNEADYIEKNLWICLEAMIKLLSATLSYPLGEELSELSQAVSVFAFEYGRYQIYKKQNEILDGYIVSQQALSEELKIQYEKYIEEVNLEKDKFNILVQEAFSPDFENLLKNSEELARRAGVAEDEILKSEADIDDFFM